MNMYCIRQTTLHLRSILPKELIIMILEMCDLNVTPPYTVRRKVIEILRLEKLYTITRGGIDFDIKQLY